MVTNLTTIILLAWVENSYGTTTSASSRCFFIALPSQSNKKPYVVGKTSKMLKAGVVAMILLVIYIIYDNGVKIEIIK